MSVAGNLVLDQHQIFKAADGTLLSGVTYPANPGVSILLTRQVGSTMIAASETVAWAEIGATGTYYFSFTPQFTGLYVLTVTSLDSGSGAGSDGDIVPFRYEILAAGAVNTPSYQNAFCAESDVERYLLQPIDATTKPNDTQAASFAEGRADRLMSLMAGLGSAITPASNIAGTRLEGMLREANAIGAAIDCVVSQNFSTGKIQAEKVVSLIAAWVALAGGYDGATYHTGDIEREIRQNTVSLATNHTLSGDTIPRDNSNPPQDVGFQVTMRDVY